MATITKYSSIAFLKVGESKNNKALQCGRLRFGSLQSYTEIEDSRKDKLETAIHLENIPEGNILTISSTEFEDLPIQINRGRIIKNNKALGHAFCLFAIQPKMIQEGSWQLSSKMIEKGDSILIIHNPKEFIRRVENALFNLGLKVHYDFTKYKSFEGYTGYKSVFEKDITYSDENEFRFFVNFLKDSNEEYLEVGDLTDISIIVENKQETGGPRFLLQTNQK